MNPRFCAVVSTVLLLLTAAAPLKAQKQSATDEVKVVLDSAMEIQTRPDLQGDAKRQERARLIRRLIAANFLSEDMARESIRYHWDKVSPRQRAEFQDLFIGLFQDSYTRMVLNFLQKETIEYRGESAADKGRMVRTVIMRANEHIPVDYLVDQRGGRWLIRDVIIDGVSIVDNYNNTFHRVIQTESFDALLNRMRVQRKAVGDVS